MIFKIVSQVHDMEVSQQTFSSKSTEEIDSLQKAKIELEERVASTEMKLQEKNEVSTFLDNVVICHMTLYQQECTSLEEKLKDFSSMEETFSNLSAELKVSSYNVNESNQFLCRKSVKREIV